VNAREGRFEYQGIVVGKGTEDRSALWVCALVLARLRSFDLAVIVIPIGNNMRKKINFHLLQSCHSLQGTGTYYKLKESIHL
jgi:hypothetical protein